MQFPTVVFTHLPAGVLHTTSSGRWRRPSISLSVRSMRSSNPCPVPTPPFLSVVKDAFPLDFLSTSSRLRHGFVTASTPRTNPATRFCRRILRFLCASSALQFRHFLDTSSISRSSFGVQISLFVLCSLVPILSLRSHFKMSHFSCFARASVISAPCTFCGKIREKPFPISFIDLRKSLTNRVYSPR